MNADTTIQQRRVTYFVMRTEPKHPRHHGLHHNPAPFVLTLHPTGGEYLELAGEARVTLRPDGTLRVTCAPVYGSSTGLGDNAGKIARIVSHLGRSAALGEDQADAAFGNDILGQLIAEQFQVDYAGHLSRGSAGWTYAPVDIEWLSLDDERAGAMQTYEGPALGAFDRD